MIRRKSFRAFGEKEDLLAIFSEFQRRFEIYYAPAYSDAGPTVYDSITEFKNLGVNRHGSHIGAMQTLIFPKKTECLWRTYLYRDSGGREQTRYSSLDAGNTAWICVDFNGVYQERAIFPTEISTIHYDDASAKALYNGLRQTFRRQSAQVVNGIYICPRAYEHRAGYRFCTIDIKSPPEYDLTVP